MRRLVVTGVDGSCESMAAADWAAQESLRRDRPLRVVRAFEWLPRQEAVLADRDTLTRQAQDDLREVGEALRGRYPSLCVTTELLRGPKVQTLLDATGGAELLVLGSRGLGGFAGFLIGSVGLATLARTQCPVVLVRTVESTAVERTPELEVPDPVTSGLPQVVLGIDVRRSCDELIRFAFETAATRRAPLHAVHVRDLPPMNAFEPRPEGDAVPGPWAEATRLLTATLRPWRDKFPDVPVTEEVATGKPVRSLLNSASGAGLLVVGRRARRARLGARIGPVTHAVLHRTRCPVAVVPHS
ncbi:universal stress protein [Streptomyces sp. Ru87]|uniref:universal stress protein n=1 Tax=Streptomyces sp. Ru87 TaxID=2044307 RepID=UPI000BF6198D|nr:universal stress protein [Streptomyces sp. Ru87]PGH47159.1 hypothetical protein CRI70_29800 [Streptomyces sp. Ru87]